MRLDPSIHVKKLGIAVCVSVTLMPCGVDTEGSLGLAGSQPNFSVKTHLRRLRKMPDVVVNTFSPSTREAEAGRSLNLRPRVGYVIRQGYRETLS